MIVYHLFTLFFLAGLLLVVAWYFATPLYEALAFPVFVGTSLLYVVAVVRRALK